VLGLLANRVQLEGEKFARVKRFVSASTTDPTRRLFDWHKAAISTETRCRGHSTYGRGEEARSKARLDGGGAHLEPITQDDLGSAPE
jgi:hypothetical protein